MADRPTDLPIYEVMDNIAGALRREQGVVLVAPTGAGKTTQVPQAILDRELVGDGDILVLEPRRVAARATAKRIAQERSVHLGREVGYQVRFDREIGDETRIKVMTEGILTRRLQDDPLLEGVDAVVLDEFHERSIHSDLAVAFLKEVCAVRDDLSLCVMSATIDPGPVAEYLDVPVVESKGRTYPVDIEYLEQPSDDDLAVQVARAVRRAIDDPDDDDGDILCFLPGAGSIHRSVDAIEQQPYADDLEVVPLYGALPPDEQDEAIEPSERRKVIVSTNIAETSLTIEGVTTVVDSGRVKQLEMSEASGLDELVETDISLASAEQRAGRAGRTRPGRAYRLWTHAYEHRMPERQDPEIVRVDVTAPVLEVIAWSGSDPSTFDWFESPPAAAIERAVRLLRGLEAIPGESFQLTGVGRRMLGVPAHPRIARMLIEGARRDCRQRVAGMAALLSERDFVFSMDRDAPPGDCDLLRRLEVLESVASGRTRSADRLGMDAHVGRARRVQQVRNQLAGAVSEVEADGVEASDEEPGARARESLAAGYPDRVAISRGDDRHYVMVNGEPLALAYESVVRDAEFVVASRIAGATRGRSTGGVDSRGLIRMATALERERVERLFSDQFRTARELEFDDEREQVMAFEREHFGAVTLSEKVISVDDLDRSADVAELLASAAAEDVEYAFGLGEDDQQFLERLSFLRAHRPDLKVPVIDEDSGRVGEVDGGRSTLEEILRQMCWGARSFDDLRRMDFRGQLKQYLDHAQLSALGKLAPDVWEAPTGKTHRLIYDGGEPPSVEVRIQEMFGLERGPRVAGGEVPVVLKLLAPNFRPAQITDNLASFWDNTYPEVRKELKARYPKHPWPDEPRDAEPVAM